MISLNFNLFYNIDYYFFFCIIQLDNVIGWRQLDHSVTELLIKSWSNSVKINNGISLLAKYLWFKIN